MPGRYGDDAGQEVLRQLAANEKADRSLRAEAASGLAHSAARAPETRRLLLGLLDKPELRRDALRSLRDALQQPEVERDVFAWWDKLEASAEERKELAAQLLLAFRSKREPAQRLKALGSVK